MGCIDKISRLQSFGIFRDYTWPTDLANFKKFNLVYGWNCSGKTTLSRVFSACEIRSIEFEQYPQGGVFEIICTSGTRIKSEDLSNCPFQVRVFNKDFIDANISFDTSNACSPIMQLSEEDVDCEKRLKEAEAAVTELQARLQSATQAREAAERANDRFLRSTALTVKQTVGNLAVRDEYYAYDKAQVERALTEKGVKGFAALSEQEAEDCKATLSASAPLRLAEVPSYELPITLAGMHVSSIDDVVMIINDLIEKQVVAETIERLKSDPELNSWVEHGLELHMRSRAKECLFCQGSLETDFLDKLSRHFNVDYSKLQSDIKQCLIDIGALLFEPIEVPADLYPEFKAEYIGMANDLNTVGEEINSWTEEAKKRLSDKLENPHAIVATIVTCKELIGRFNSLVADVNRLIVRHNEKVENHDMTIKGIRDKLAEHLIAIAIADQDFMSISKELHESRENESAVQGLIGEKREEITELRRRTSNIGGALKQINKHLEEFFGWKEIQLELDGDERSYIIQRDGVVACNLSEGEKTAIAFSYFLVKTEEAGFLKEESIVVIDDPISSLDSNFVFHCFSLLKNHFTQSEQLFVLTHNFELFNLVKSWFSRMNKCEELCGFYMVENANSDDVRYAKICPLEDTLLRYQSEYHYLFIKLSDFVASGQLKYHDLYTISNVARRFLEVFASFKIPTSGDLASKLDQLAKEGQIDDVKKDKVYKLVNEYSHGHDPKIAIEHKDRAEVQEAVRILLEIVKKTDPRHFELLAKNVKKK